MARNAYAETKMQTKNAPRTKGVGNYMSQSGPQPASPTPRGAAAGMNQGKANEGSVSNMNGPQALMGQGGQRGSK